MILKLRDQNKVLVKGFPGSFDAAARKRNVDIAPLRALVQRRLVSFMWICIHCFCLLFTKTQYKCRCSDMQIPYLLVDGAGEDLRGYD